MKKKLPSDPEVVDWISGLIGHGQVTLSMHKNPTSVEKLQRDGRIGCPLAILQKLQKNYHTELPLSTQLSYHTRTLLSYNTRTLLSYDSFIKHVHPQEIIFEIYYINGQP